jgi:integrase
MLQKRNFELADRKDLENVILQHGRQRVRGHELSDDTKSGFKIMTKRFYKWLKDPEDEEYPPEVKWIRTNQSNNHSIIPEEILTEADVEVLIKAADWSRDKAIIAMLFDLGSRTGEFLSLQRKNIVFYKLGAMVVVDGKTGRRRQRLILSVPFLSQWLNDHPDKKPEAPLWIHSTKGCHEEGIVHLDYYSLRKLLIRLGRTAGIKRRVNPYAFRHARATHLANYLTEAQLKQVFGWTQNSRMPGRYVHLSGRDVDNALLRVHGLRENHEEEKAKITLIKCVRSELENSTIQKQCTRCGMPLDLKTALELEDERTKHMEDLQRQAELQKYTLSGKPNISAKIEIMKAT